MSLWNPRSTDLTVRVGPRPLEESYDSQQSFLGEYAFKVVETKSRECILRKTLGDACSRVRNTGNHINGVICPSQRARER